MRKILIATLILFLLTSFTSCAVVNSLLGYDECSYPDCTNTCVKDCNYCSKHCNSYNVPGNFDKKIHQSIDKQLEQHRTDQKRSQRK